tara:strand:- start:6957 stop:7802 length:846 start_codon:yes stop_codon:yes gene_type:complete
MSIPEVGSKNRLLHFIETYLKKIGPSPSITPYSSYDDLVISGQEDSSAGINIICNADAYNAGVALGRKGDANPVVGYFTATADSVNLGSFQSGHSLNLYSSNYLVPELTVTPNAQISMPYQPAVSARMSASGQAFTSSYTALTTVKFDTLTSPGFEVGVGDDYNPSTGVYTAGATSGKYMIRTSIMLTGVPKASTLRLACLTSKSAAAGVVMYADRLQGTDFTWTTSTDMTYPLVQGTWLVDLAATETAEVLVQATAGDSGTSIAGHASSVYTWLSIMRVA